MRWTLSVLATAFGLLAIHLELVNAGLRHERELLLNTVATEIAHEYVESEDRLIMGDIAVEPIGGMGYRAIGRAIGNGRTFHWSFTFCSDTPAVPGKVDIAAD